MRAARYQGSLRRGAQSRAHGVPGLDAEYERPSAPDLVIHPGDIERALGLLFGRAGSARMTPVDVLAALAVAVAAGGLIGAERQQAHGTRSGDFGGVRTFPLLAIVGVIAALLRPVLGAWVVGALLLAVVVSLGAVQARARSDDSGVSSEVAALVTFSLGVMSATPELMPDASRYLVVAGIAAITMALLRAEATLARLHRENFE